MEARLRQALARAEEVASALANPATAGDQAKLRVLGREHNRLAPVVQVADRLQKLTNELRRLGKWRRKPIPSDGRACPGGP